VKHDVCTLGKADHLAPISNIGLVYVKRRVPIMLVDVPPSPGGEIINDCDFVVAGHELIDNVTADEPRAASH
jgi:hypothetical protein